MDFTFLEIEDYDAAICSYLISGKYHTVERIQTELFFITQKTGKSIDFSKYDFEATNRIIGKNNINIGISDEVTAVSYSISNKAMEDGNFQFALQVMGNLYELTAAEEIKAILSNIEACIKENEEDDRLPF